MIKKIIFPAFFLLIFVFFIAYKIYSKEKVIFRIPVITIAKDCVLGNLSEITWLDGQSYKYSEFTHVVPSMPYIEGYLELTSYANNSTRIEPIINTLFDKCYPGDLNVWNASNSLDQLLSESLPLVIYETKPSANYIYIEINKSASKMSVTSK